jgi:hypothetical protein
MPEDAQHPHYPDRRLNGTFLPGHRRYGGRRWTGGPREWPRRIKRLFQRLENRYARMTTKYDARSHKSPTNTRT